MRLPIIAMTAHAMAGDREKSLAIGMDDHVAKPIDPNELFTILEKWIPPAENRKPVDKPPILSSDRAHETNDVPAPPQSQPDAGQDGLPHVLPGFDLADGLRRLQGNRKLYRKLLLDFNRKYASTADNIQQALSANDLNQAHSLVHSIKGLAGNLSAIDLHSAATEMDALVKQALSGKLPEAGHLERTFAEFKNALEKALTASQTLKPSATEITPQPAEQPIQQMSAERANQTAQRLREAVDMGNISELKTIANELRSGSDTYDNFSETIDRLAEDFDLEGILKLCDRLGNQSG